MMKWVIIIIHRNRRKKNISGQISSQQKEIDQNSNFYREFTYFKIIVQIVVVLRKKYMMK